MENTEQQEYVPTIFMGKEDVSSIKEVLKKDKEHIIEAVRNGEVNPLEVQMRVKILENAVKEIKDGINEEVLSEAEKYGSKYFEYKGGKFSVSERKTYDFTSINEWNEINSQINDLKAKQKTIETKYKTANVDNVIVDMTTGETITSVPYKTTKIISVK